MILYPQRLYGGIFRVTFAQRVVYVIVLSKLSANPVLPGRHSVSYCGVPFPSIAILLLLVIPFWWGRGP